jgi:hypothetical protein
MQVSFIFLFSCIYEIIIDGLVWLMVLSAIFNDILVISWMSVILVEETRVLGETEIIIDTCRKLSWSL